MRVFLEKMNLKLKETWAISRGSVTEKDNILLKLKYKDFTGYGEASPSKKYDEEFSEVWNFILQAEPNLIDPSKIKETLNDLNSISQNLNSAKACIDMAMYDIMGKMANKPLFELLGVKPKYAPSCSKTVFIDTEENMLAHAMAYKNFSLLKIKFNSALDVALIPKIYEKTKKPIIIDVNEGWNPDEALDKIKYLEKFDFVLFIEQPIEANHLDDLALLRSKTRMKIFLDEDIQSINDIKHKRELMHGINIKLMKCGGIYRAIEMITSARKFNLGLMLGCMIESSIGISAASHLMHLVDFVDLDSIEFIANDKFEGSYFNYGKLVLSGNSGLGVREIEKAN
jgi:L-alanine-DL-glutamate epimerase-like enolase superfamily enzyme